MMRFDRRGVGASGAGNGALWASSGDAAEGHCVRERKEDGKGEGRSREQRQGKRRIGKMLVINNTGDDT